MTARLSFVNEVLGQMRPWHIEPPPAYAGPILCWQDAVDAMEWQEALDRLSVVLRTRRRELRVGEWTVSRSELRDYLRQRGVPRWLRSRPRDPGAPATIKFRRWVPYKRSAT